MKRWALVLGGFVCAILAFWAYLNSGQTRIALAHLRELNAQIAKEREHIEILRAEWAILNRPERLRQLVAQHNARLQLEPITADVYGVSSGVSYEVASSQNADYIDPNNIEAILQGLIDSGEISVE